MSVICPKFCNVFLALCPGRTSLLFLTALFLLSGCGDIGSPGNSGGGVGNGGVGGQPNLIPTVAALDPASVAAAGPDFYLSVYGTGFTSSSVVRWNGSDLTTTLVSSSQVFALVGAGNRSSSGTFPIAVFNPAPGGGLSNASSVLVGPVPATPQGVGVLQLVSAAPDGTPGNGASYTPPALSANGRYVAFQSDSTNLVAGPASGFTEIYIRDTCLGAQVGCTPSTTRVSVANDGSLPNGNSRSPAISANGRYVAFDSSATNLFPGSTQTNGQSDVFIRDTCIGGPTGCVPATALVSLANDGSQANNDSRGATVSGDGRFVAFGSTASNLVPNSTNGLSNVFLADTCIGASTSCTPNMALVSVANDGNQANGPSGISSMSADGRYISFRTGAANLLPPNSLNGGVILRDTCFSAPSGCTPTNRTIFVGYPGDPVKGAVDNLWVLSANARYSGFGSEASNLVPGNPGQMVGAFVYDDCIGAPAACIPHTDQISLTYNGGQPDNGSAAAVSSNDGNHVVFISIADNLLPYAYRSSAVYVRMTCTNATAGCVPTTYLLSLDSNTGIQGNTSYSDYPAITPDGQYAVFISDAANWPGSLQSNGKNQVWLARVF